MRAVCGGAGMYGSGSRVAAAVVMGLVMASVGFLLLVSPGLWWISTIYGWVVFPALGTLAGSRRTGAIGGIEGIGAVPDSSVPAPSVSVERRVLEVLVREGESSAARVALAASVSVAGAEEVLSRLASDGYIEVVVRDGGIFYSMWDSRNAPEHRWSSGVGGGDQ